MCWTAPQANHLLGPREPRYNREKAALRKRTKGVDVHIPSKEPTEYTPGDLTVLKILDATERLAREHSLDEITVANITREAGISRQAFYNHFKDKYNIAQWYWDYCARLFLERSGKSLSWFDANLGSLNLLSEHATFLKSMLQSDDYNSPLNYGRRRRIELLTEAVRQKAPEALDEELLFEIEFFADAESRAIASWMLHDMPIPTERLARYLEDCVPPRLHELLAM